MYQQQPGYPPQGPAPGAPAPVQLTPQQQQMLADVDVLPGEQIMYAIQGDGYFLGTSPAAKAIAAFQAFMVSLTGGYIRILIVITNQRVLLLNQQQVWCGWMRIRGVNAMPLAAIQEVGWGKETQWCCIHSRVIHMESLTQKHTLVIKKLGDPALKHFIVTMSRIMLEHGSRRP